MAYNTFSEISYLYNINLDLLERFKLTRLYHGSPSKEYLLNKINREKTRIIIPPGWEFK